MMRDAEDRLFVRRRVLQMIEEAFGADSAPALLSMDRVRVLRPLLEQEFDLDLADADLIQGPHSNRLSVERLTSSIQHVMERGSAVALHTHVAKARDDQREIVENLQKRLSRSLKEAPDAEPTPVANADERSSFVAVYRGKCVGCVDVYPVDQQSYQVRDLFVEEDFRHHGVGRLLVRAAIEHAADAGRQCLFIDLSRVPDAKKAAEVQRFSERYGFRRDDSDGLLKYTLVGGWSVGSGTPQ